MHSKGWKTGLKTGLKHEHLMNLSKKYEKHNVYYCLFCVIFNYLKLYNNYILLAAVF